jgi:hypothetical protein
VTFGGTSGVIDAEGSPVALQLLAFRTAVEVRRGIVREVAAREGAVFPIRLIHHRYVRLDALFVDQPVEHLS